MMIIQVLNDDHDHDDDDAVVASALPSQLSDVVNMKIRGYLSGISLLSSLTLHHEYHNVSSNIDVIVVTSVLIR